MSAELRDFIDDFIRRQVKQAGTQTTYREPLVGFAAAHDPAWLEVRKVGEPTHYLPTDLLPEAKTVVAFFLPFGKEVVVANHRAEISAREWAVAYLETNNLINSIVEALEPALSERGVKAAGVPATHNYDPKDLIARWSHKSAAYIAGLGSFGLHRMLITDSGCAGRFGSFVIDAFIEPASHPQPDRCLYFATGTCTRCVDSCPVGALKVGERGEMNIDKHLCNSHLLENAGTIFADLPDTADCCGKCAVGPCAMMSAVW